MSEKPTPAAPKKAASTKAAAAPTPTEPEQAPVPTAPEPTIQEPTIQEPTNQEPPTSAGIGGLRIVVAEDEALIRLDLAEMLAELGYDVVGQASDGEQAVALVQEHRPDVVIMDVKMPVLDGISAAEQIGKERIAPVIMLTAFSQKELVERARDAGVMAYIVKPFTQADLAPAVDIATSRWAELKALEGEIADLGERLETRKAVDRAKGILMTRLKLSEADAFRWIQKTAMDRRLGMREVADAVISQMPATK
ncbi:MAG TPA: response regulator [Lapillicoccus sp.]|uniref:ANTAR domain-containing response regulator n=1 Tax=Lapillicoccus sp. TaxID=1909287 RepID=UPI002F943576